MCDCRLCERHRRIEKVCKSKKVKDLVALVRELETDLEHIELDHQVDQAILRGTWPQARHILTKALEKAEKFALEHPDAVE